MYFPCILSFINAYLLCLSAEFSFGIDGAVMPSWFDIHEIPVTAVSSLVSIFLHLAAYSLCHESRSEERRVRERV